MSGKMSKEFYNNMMRDFSESRIIYEGRYIYGDFSWKITEGGILLLKGNGEMCLAFDGNDEYYGLWLPRRECVKGIIISSGVIGLQEAIFCGHPALNWIALPPGFKLNDKNAEYDDYFDNTQMDTIYGHENDDSELFANMMKLKFSLLNEGLKTE